jgi:hypothetical protein
VPPGLRTVNREPASERADQRLDQLRSELLDWHAVVEAVAATLHGHPDGAVGSYRSTVPPACTAAGG